MLGICEVKGTWMIVCFVVSVMRCIVKLWNGVGKGASVVGET